MKARLFWKILLGFWLTLFCIIEGLWLVFVFARGNPTPEQWVARRVSPPLLAVLAHDVSTDGLGAYQKAVSMLPPDDRGQIAIEPVGGSRSADRTVAASRLARAPDGRIYRLSYGYPATKNRSGPFNIPWPILVAGAVAGFAFSFILAWYLTRPIKLLRNGFDRLAQGDLNVRLRDRVGRRRDEIADLALDFDTMAHRLEQLVTARDRLLHDVSHELRSPLSRLQLAIGLARQDPARLDRSLDRIEQEAGKLETMVRELLVLARAESGAAQSEEYFDPIAALQSLLADADFEARANDIVFSTRLGDIAEEGRPAIRGSAELFRRALENIIRNALRFAPRGTTVTFAAALAATGEAYEFTVSDEGPGAQDLDVSTLFDPFVSADRTGFGLGLAIAKRAIVAHGGKIEAGNLDGNGFRVVITLPASRPDA